MLELDRSEIKLKAVVKFYSTNSSVETGVITEITDGGVVARVIGGSFLYIPFDDILTVF